MGTFLNAFANPPWAALGEFGSVDTTSTSALDHPIPSDRLPNRVIDRPGLAEELVGWARWHLQNNINHRPGIEVQSLFTFLPNVFYRTHLGNEASVTKFYSRVIESYSDTFVQDADQLAPDAIRFDSCVRINGVISDWEWQVHGESRMVVEHKATSVFDAHCDEIRALATAGNDAGSVLALNTKKVARGAMSILWKLGRQMIADNCQLGMLFGGHRFILFTIYEENVDGVVHHRMLCSRIHQTRPTDGFAGAMQVTIAALLGQKHSFLLSKQLPPGIEVGQRKKDPELKAGSKASRGSKRRAAAPSVHTMATRSSRTHTAATHIPPHTIQQVRMSYSAAPTKYYLFYRVGRNRTQGGRGKRYPPKSTAGLELQESIGHGCSGIVFDANLKLAEGGSDSVAAKFFDPSSSKQSDTQRIMFDNEVRAYERLADTSMCLRFYGGFRGKGFTGKETYIILLEKLSGTFRNYSQMTQSQKKIAYESVLELHRRGVHHGDVEARNFGLKTLRTRGTIEDALVIYDFSHAMFFDEECDPEQCCELEFARRQIIEGGYQPETSGV